MIADCARQAQGAPIIAMIAGGGVVAGIAMIKMIAVIAGIAMIAGKG